jgi:hypothetical protein
MKKRLLAAAVTAALVVGGFWVAGVDFDERGLPQALCYILVVGAALIACIAFDDRPEMNDRGEWL